METYHFEGEEKILSPALIYYKDGIVNNTKRAIKEAGGAAHLWPHVKSHKMVQIMRLQAEMGIKRFKCATVAEAAAAAKAGGERILLAYPLVGPNQEPFLELMKQWPDKIFYTIGDNQEQIEKLAEKARGQGMTVNLFVDVNTGMNRTGVEICRLGEFCKSLGGISGLNMAGFHCYDGNGHEKDAADRRDKVKETGKEILAVIEGITKETRKTYLLVMGGSPTFPCYARDMKDENVFYSPGTVFIYDAGYQEQFPDLPYEPAAAVLARVVSHPAKGYFTIDCGYKAVSAEQVCPGVLADVPHAKPAFQSEEHWTFRMERGYEKERPSIGQIVYVIPWHICPTTVLYQEAVVVSGQKAEAVWTVSARNRMSGNIAES